MCQENETRIKEGQAQQRDLTRRGRERTLRIQQAEQSLSQFDSQEGKQYIKLRNLSSEASTLWQWIQQHPNEFEKTVFGPPVVECSIKDPKYVDLIEALFQRTLFVSFTVQTKNDFTKVSNIAHDHLNLSDVNIKTVPFGLDQFQAPMDEENMRRYGFEGWALDYINGPKPVLAMLCADIRLQETGISMRDTTPQQFEMLQDSVITSWVTRKSSYRLVRRREYGPGARSTQVRNVRPAYVWTDQPVDLTAKRELQETMKELGEEIRGFETENKKIGDSINGFRRALETASRELVCFRLQ